HAFASVVRTALAVLLDRVRRRARSAARRPDSREHEGRDMMSTPRTPRTQRRKTTFVSLVSFVSNLSIALAAAASLSAQRTPGAIDIRVLSTRADRVSGGDVLIAMAPAAAMKAPPVVMLNGRDISPSF